MLALFRKFPQGLPGIALLIVRLSLAVALSLRMQESWPQVPIWLLVGYCVAAFSLLFGLFTTGAAFLAALVYGLAWMSLHGPLGSLVEFALDSVALALIGPGAYSIDSVRFGHRAVKWSSDTYKEE
jgi:putative oxidoreductase